MIDAKETYRKYLDPQVISKLGPMDVRARLVVEGFMAGMHKSPYHGFSVEFAEHRQYMPGDELKHIDWKVYAKTDRFYVKQFEEETNLKSYLLVDRSASMNFTSGGVTKFEYATYLAAALSYLMIRKQRDAVGLVTFDEDIQTIMPAKSVASYLSELLIELEQTQPSKATHIAKTLNEIAERVQRRGLIILMSDLFDENLDEVLQGLKHFRHRNHEVIVFQILDPQEMQFKYSADVEFIDLETQAKIKTQPTHIRSAYLELFQEFLQKVKSTCREHNIDYMPISTDTPFDEALLNYLQRRARIGG